MIDQATIDRILDAAQIVNVVSEMKEMFRNAYLHITTNREDFIAKWEKENEGGR